MAIQSEEGQTPMKREGYIVLASEMLKKTGQKEIVVRYWDEKEKKWIVVSMSETDARRSALRI